MPQHLAPPEIRQRNRNTDVQQRVSILIATVFADSDGVWTCQVHVDDNAAWGEEQAANVARSRIEHEIMSREPLAWGDITVSLAKEERLNSTDPARPGSTVYTYRETA